MSNYSKLTNFASKDSLASGNPLKVIKGTEIDDEFEAIETAVATKVDSASPTITGTATITTANITTLTVSGTTTLGSSTTINSKTPALLGVQQNFAKAQYTAPTAITLSSSQTADLETSNVFIVTVNGDGYTLDTSNMVSGGCYTFVIKNTGAFDIDFGSEFYFSGGDPVITSGAGKRDLISCVSDGSALYCSINYDLEASS